MYLLLATTDSKSKRTERWTLLHICHADVCRGLSIWKWWRDWICTTTDWRLYRTSFPCTSCRIWRNWTYGWILWSRDTRTTVCTWSMQWPNSANSVHHLFSLCFWLGCPNQANQCFESVNVVFLSVIDDYPVRDRERKAALMHFSSEANLDTNHKKHVLIQDTTCRYCSVVIVNQN